MIKDITLQEFEKIKKEGSVVVEFYTTWCGDCHMMAPTYENLASNFKDTQFFKINAEEANVFRKNGGYNILKVPTFIFYKNGVEVGRTIEYNPIEKMQKMVIETLK